MIKSDAMHGIARYVFELLSQFREIGKEHRFYILVGPSSPLYQIQWPPHMELVEVKSRWISFREQYELPQILRQIEADLFHSPSFVGPLFCPCQLIMTIHDLNHVVLPQFYTPLHQFYYLTFVQTCIRRSRFILTVSQFSKNEIVKNLGLPEDKVFVTYNGVAANYRPLTDNKNWLFYVKELYELPDEFIFCLSNDKPHKNIQQLVRAYCLSKLKTPLVLGGPTDEQLFKIADSYGKKHLLYFTRFIEEVHLPAIYNLCKFFAYPSTYEGFGLPPLEALACGVPVLVARSSSLPEVVGEYGIFVDPYDIHQMANLLENLPALAEDKRQKGILHAQQFSWREMGEKTLSVYERCR
ncbi:MAG: glycosyltransferase family 4 protein [Oligoflexales bacterium]|nr:glycosyltransferase family 4 protein [Oligoflexales bacterium]